MTAEQTSPDGERAGAVAASVAFSVTDLDRLGRHRGLEPAPEPVPVVVLAAAADDALVERAVELLGLRRELVDRLRSATTLRPRLRLEQGDIVVELAVVGRDAGLLPVRCYAGPRGLLVLTEASAPVRDALTTAAGTGAAPPVVLAALLALLAQVSDDNLEALGVDAQQQSRAAPRYVARAERTQMLSTRAQLMAVSNLCTAQQRYTDDDEDFVLTHPECAAQLRVANARFGYVAELASRLYAVLGDSLSEQSTIVSERLTLVNTIFLPLTLAASFFGMNFGWLTDRTTSGTAFVLLGLLTPAVLVVITVLAIRRLVR